MSEHVPKPKLSGANVQVELDLSNYAKKTDLKNDTSDFAKNTDFNLKSDVGKLDIDKSKNIPSNLSNLK